MWYDLMPSSRIAVTKLDVAVRASPMLITLSSCGSFLRATWPTPPKVCWSVFQIVMSSRESAESCWAPAASARSGERRRSMGLVEEFVERLELAREPGVRRGAAKFWRVLFGVAIERQAHAAPSRDLKFELHF